MVREKFGTPGLADVSHRSYNRRVKWWISKSV